MKNKSQTIIEYIKIYRNQVVNNCGVQIINYMLDRCGSLVVYQNSPTNYMFNVLDEVRQLKFSMLNEINQTSFNKTVGLFGLDDYTGFADDQPNIETPNTILRIGETIRSQQIFNQIKKIIND